MKTSTKERSEGSLPCSGMVPRMDNIKLIYPSSHLPFLSQIRINSPWSKRTKLFGTTSTTGPYLEVELICLSAIKPIKKSCLIQISIDLTEITNISKGTESHGRNFVAILTTLGTSELRSGRFGEFNLAKPIWWTFERKNIIHFLCMPSFT